MKGWIKYHDFYDTLAEITQILEENVITCLCGKKLNKRNLQVSESGGEFWIYTHCNYCKYDLNYVKILHKYDVLQNERNI